MRQIKKILLIEDTDVGETYKEMLEQYNSNWQVIWIKSISELKRVDDLESMHVFVFDQRLGNNELGTDAFQYVHKINPRIQGIMLSGVAMARDLSLAQQIAGRKIQHLVKDDVLQLPEYVIEAISAYYASIQKRTDNLELSSRLKFRLFSKKPKIILLNHYLVDSRFLFDEDWKVQTRVRCGEDVKKLELTAITSKEMRVFEQSTSMQVDLSNNFDQIKQALIAHFQSQEKVQLENSCEYKSQREHEYKLPEIPASPTEDHPVEVRFEYNQIYKHIRAHVAIECYSCGTKNYCDYDIYIPTQHVAWRQVAHYALGTTRVINL